MNKVCVILATYNRAKLLNLVLNDLKDQQLDGSCSVEVLIVDNSSKDETKSVVDGFLLELKKQSNQFIEFRYIFEPAQGKSHALNRGIKEASADIVAFTDDDVTIDSKWLWSMVNCFKEHNCDCVGGRVLPVYPPNTPAWVKEYRRQMAGVVVLYDYGEETKEYDSSMDLFIGANYAFKRSVFEECGLFRIDLSPGRAPVGEDLEFVQRLVDKNKKIYYCGQALMWHPVNLERMKFKNTAHWHKELGRYAARSELERESKRFTYWFGVPRYLIKGIIKDFFLLLVSFYHRRIFFNSTRTFFRKYGMIQEYRSIYKEKR